VCPWPRASKKTNRDVIRRQLELLGYAAEIAADGAAALALYGQRHYGLLLTDCHMPEMDGFALTDAIHKLKSSARAVGAVELAALCQGLEEAGAAADLERIGGLHARIGAAMREVTAYVEALPDTFAPKSVGG
jgi:CheY-like chemotaxis protein